MLLAALIAVTSSSTALWTGDLDGMIARREIRVLTTYSKTGYFVDKGVPRGLVYDAFRTFEDDLNAKLKTGNLKVHVVCIPVAPDELEKGLLTGRGDIVAANMTITEARLKQEDFSTPLVDDVREVVVTGPDAPAIAALDDLAGQIVHVRVPSLYQQHLAALSATFVKAGKKPIAIRELPANLEDEDILEMTNAGLIKITLVNDFLAAFWKPLLPSMIVHDDVSVEQGEQVAYAMRKGSPQLKAALDAFVKTHRKGAAFGKELFTKYLENAQDVRPATSPGELAKFEALLDLFRKYGDQYRVDWLLMAAQGYQESGLDQKRRSRAGAVGVMQVMPATESALKVGDISQIGPNINAGTKYMRQVIDQNFSDDGIDPLNQALFAFAAYNAGPARVNALRAETAGEGLNPNVWFNNVERVASARDGRDTVQYVANIYKYYVGYKLAIVEMAERKGVAPAPAKR